MGDAGVCLYVSEAAPALVAYLATLHQGGAAAAAICDV